MAYKVAVDLSVDAQSGFGIFQFGYQQYPDRGDIAFVI
jgi:hypothetical protein